VLWHPFELNPQMAEGGVNLRDHLAAKYGTTIDGSIKALVRLTEMVAALGFVFEYADDMRMVNTFRAHQMIDCRRGHCVASLKMGLFETFAARCANGHSGVRTILPSAVSEPGALKPR
jgi:predicted DsbA family dithiol-disulfide isomerase